MQRQKKPISWVWIILALIIFWPVGLLLLVFRLVSDRSAVMTCGRTLGIVSWILIVLGLLIIFGDEVIIGCVFMLGGICLNVLSRKTKKRAALYRQYISLVANHRMTSLDEISAAIGLSFDTVTSDLTNMINAGYFSGLYIDAPGRRLVLPQATAQQAPQPAGGAVGTQNISQPRVVQCVGCGANAALMSAVGTCEYCGCPLH